MGWVIWNEKFKSKATWGLLTHPVDEWVNIQITRLFLRGIE